MAKSKNNPTASLLFIDDDAVFRRLMTAMFTQDGFKVFVAADAEAGFRFMEERSFQAAIVDYSLPGLNGINFFERTRRISPEMTRILLTAYTTEELLLEAINRGEVYRYLTKPVHLGLLRSTVEQALVLHGLNVAKTAMTTEMDRRTKELEGKNNDLLNYYHLLGELKSQQDQILSSLPEPFFLLGADHRILRCNQAGTELLGLTRGELLGKSADDLFLDPAELTERIYDTGRSGVIYFETLWRHKAGTNVPVKVALNLFRGDAVENNQVTLVVQDITSVKQLENLLRSHSLELEQKVEDQILQIVKQQKALAHSDKLAALGTLVAGAAHEINSCDSFIKTNVEVLQHYWVGLEPILKNWVEVNPTEKIGRQLVGEVVSDLSGLLDDLNVGATQLGGIVEGMLAFSRKDVRKKEALQLEEAVASALTVTGTRLAKNFKVRTKFCQAGLAVNGNRGQVIQVLVDLIMNACDAYEDRESIKLGHMTIFIRPDALRRQLVISISDNAGGMSNETATHVFDPFFTTKKGKGTGLGLAICHGIINEHGGEIWVKSRPGIGSAFSFSLPIIDSDLSNIEIERLKFS